MPAQSSSPVSARYRLKPELVALGGLVLLTFVIALNRFIYDAWVTRHELADFVIPWYGYLGDLLRGAHIPGWNPHVFAGTPFAGNPKSGWMYLPAMALFPLLQATTAYKAMVLGQLLIAGVSTYLYGRLIGLGIYASLVAATAYQFGPFLFQNMYCCTARAQVATWIPLAFVGVELALLTTRWRYRLAAWCIGGIAVSQWFSGFMGQGAVAALILLAAYVVYRAIFSAMRPGRAPLQWLVSSLSTGIGMVAFGLALGAAGWLVRLAARPDTTLSSGDLTRLGQSGGSMPPRSVDHLLTLVFGSGYDKQAVALGGAVIVLAMLAPFLAGRRYGVPFFFVMTVVAYVLTLNTTQLHRLFYLIPTFRQLHEGNPLDITAIVLIGPAMLAAATVECLPRWKQKLHADLALAVPLIVLVVVTVILSGQPAVVGKWSIGIGIGVLGLLLAALLVPPDDRWSFDGSLMTRWVPLALIVVIVMQFAGLQVVQSTFGLTIDHSWSSAYKPSPGPQNPVASSLISGGSSGPAAFLQKQLAKDGPFRIVTYAGVGSLAYPFQWTRDQETALDAPGTAPLINAPAMQLGLYDMQGFDPFQLQDYNDFMSVLNGAETDDRFAVMRTSGAQSPLLNMLNVRYIVVDARLPADRSDVVAIARGRPVAFRNDQVIIYENTAALPHVWLVHDVRQADGMNGARAFAAGTLDPRLTATVDGTPPAVAAAPRTTPDQAAVTDYQPDYLAVTVKASANGFLVLSDVYADGWKATVDGKEARIYRANGALRGVAVPAGEHTVQFTYAPGALKLGLAITGVTGVGMIAVFALALIGLWFDYRARVVRWYRGPLMPRRLERDPAVAILPRGEGRRLSWRGARILRRPPPP